eukprot:3717417-Rhodomonas_salina.1
MCIRDSINALLDRASVDIREKRPAAQSQRRVGHTTKEQISGRLGRVDVEYVWEVRGFVCNREDLRVAGVESHRVKKELVRCWNANSSAVITSLRQIC